MASGRRRMPLTTSRLSLMVYWSLSIMFLSLIRSFSYFRPLIQPGAKETEEALKKELSETKDQVKVLKDRTKEAREGERHFP